MRVTDEMIQTLRERFLADGNAEAVRACDSALEPPDPCERRWPTATPLRAIDRKWCADAINARSR